MRTVTRRHDDMELIGSRSVTTASPLPSCLLAFTCCLLGLLTLCNLSFAQEMAEPIAIDSGQIAGLRLGEKKDVLVFKGIPYAAPPVGPLRWKPPQAVRPWQGIRHCTAFGPACPQPGLLGPWGGKPEKLNEDCLYLNVWTAARNAGEKRPVMLWIHGGGNIAGSSDMPYYDGEALARKGIVLVSLNYRLGIFGYFAHPLLSAESSRAVSGNYGLLDQIAALQWIQRNIKAFGGDPHCVTIFGESAGAVNVVYLMGSPLAKGLFHRAIAESGSALRRNRHLKERWHGQESLEEQGTRLVREAGWPDASLDALRSLDAETLLKGSQADGSLMGLTGRNRFSPGVDGWALPDDLERLFAERKGSDVPFITGANGDEGSVFVAKPAVGDVESYRVAARKMFGPFADKVLSLYPAGQPGEILRATRDLTGDMMFVCGARHLVRSLQSGKSKIYLYHYTRTWPGPLLSTLGAFHSAEIPFVFDNLRKGRVIFDEGYDGLARAMSGYWVQFARTGDPNRQDLPMWPSYNQVTDQYLEFGDEIKIGRSLRKEKCDILDQFAATQQR